VVVEEEVVGKEKEEEEKEEIDFVPTPHLHSHRHRYPSSYCPQEFCQIREHSHLSHTYRHP
jgi:hypothetical protein